MKQLILGGARSGKSSLAERLATERGQEVVYIATATGDDEEMVQRIRQHQQRRPPGWKLVESPLTLSAELEKNAADSRCVLVDCLTLWLSNWLMLDDMPRYEEEKTRLLILLPQLPGDIILVSNETGMGVVPMGELTRCFVDEAGWMHQALARCCDRVILTVAGLPQVLKGPNL